MAQQRPTRAPGGCQEGPEEGSKRDIEAHLTQRPLREPPGTLPDPSGERFWDQFGTNLDPQNGAQEAKVVHRTRYRQSRRYRN